MDDQQKKRIIMRYKELLQFYFRTGRREPDFSDKSFANFLDVLYPVLSGHRFYCNDIFISSVIWHLESKNEMSEFIGEQQIEDLIKHIEKNFMINKDMHYLIFPLQGSGLKQDICFSKFHILTKKDELSMIEKISTITTINKLEVKHFLEHTKNSRSKDFLKANIMIIEVENQTENVRHSAYQLAQNSVDFLMLMHSAFNMKSSIFRKSELWEDENKHVAILSKDGWRCGHGFSWNAHLQCKLDLDFMSEPQYQEVFEKLFTSFALNKNADDLTYRFINSFLLYSRGVVQNRIQRDESLALLLYITALESLITDGQQEKRLRLAAIIPKIISIDGLSSLELSKTIDELYKKRNNFVHAGKDPYFSYDDNKLKLLERMTSLMILKYFEVDSLLLLKPNQSRINAWMIYLDDVFNNIIFG